MRLLGSQYALDSVIGRGASGEVWRGHSRNGERLAFKLLRKEFAGDPETVARFVQEREFLRSVEHENLVRLRDMVVEGRTLALVMELEEGGDLKERLNAGQRFSAVDVCRLAAQIANGLSAIHSAGIVHGDIKPANVLVGERNGWPVARITDFSIARIAGSNESLVSGTPSYVAPELFTGQMPSVASDIYALGTLTYELLAGRPPFRGDSMDEVASLHAQAVPSRPDDVPDDVWAIVLRLLAKEPSQRPRDASTVRAMFMDPRLAELSDNEHTVQGLYRPKLSAEQAADDPHDGQTRALVAGGIRRPRRAKNAPPIRREPPVQTIGDVGLKILKVLVAATLLATATAAVALISARLWGGPTDSDEQQDKLIAAEITAANWRAKGDCERVLGDWMGAVIDLDSRLAKAISLEEYTQKVQRINELGNRIDWGKATLQQPYCMKNVARPLADANMDFHSATAKWTTCYNDEQCNLADTTVNDLWLSANRKTARARKVLQAFRPYRTPGDLSDSTPFVRAPD